MKIKNSMTPGRCGFGPGMVVGRLAGEEPGLFDVCECGKLVSCAFGPKCPENPHIVVRRCKACTLRGKAVRGTIAYDRETRS